MSHDAGPYCVLPEARFGSPDLLLRSVEPTDIEQIRQWRNAQMNVLRQSTPISYQEQIDYFATHVWPEKHCANPSQILFAIERAGVFIGYGGLVHISWPYQRAEVSFLLSPELEQNIPAHSQIFEKYLQVLKPLAFESLGIKRLTAETYVDRVHVIATFERCAFVREGRLRQHVVVDGRRTDALIHGCNAPSTGFPGRNVLVTSVSRKAPLLREIKNALQQIVPDAKVIAGDADPTVPSRYVADDFWAMPPNEDAELRALIRGCQERGIGAVWPTRDGELLFWARHQAAFAANGIAVLVSPMNAVARCLDKLAFSHFGAAEGLPIIPAADDPEGLNDGPLVVKERFGAGGRGIGVNLNAEAARAHAQTLDSPIFQPFVAGPEISIDAWLDRRGAVAGVVLRSRDRVSQGESEITTTFQDEGIEAQARSVLERLNLRGSAVMQAIVTAEGIRVIEVNPRFGGASTLSIAAGLNMLYWSLAEAYGEATHPVFRAVAGRLRLVRLPSDMILYDSDL